jgi:hypothetical protein
MCKHLDDVWHTCPQFASVTSMIVKSLTTLSFWNYTLLLAKFLFSNIIDDWVCNKKMLLLSSLSLSKILVMWIPESHFFSYSFFLFWWLLVFVAFATGWQKVWQFTRMTDTYQSWGRFLCTISPNSSVSKSNRPHFVIFCFLLY